MVTFFITSTMLILSVLAVRFLLKNRVSFLILYPLWGLVLIRLLVPFTPFESPVSVMNIISQADKKAEVALQKEEPKGQASVKETAENPKEEAVLWNQEEQKKQTEQKQQEEPKQAEEKETAKEEEKAVKENISVTGQTSEKNLSENNTQEKTAVRQDIPKEGWHIQMKKWGIGLWVTGSILLLLCILLSNILFYKRLRSDRVRIDCADILKTPDIWVDEMQAVPDKELPVYVTGQVHTPCLAGVLHPAVYLPTDVYKDKKSLRQILAHEQMHVIHKDYIWTLLRTLCLVIYWFDPFVWLAAFCAKQDAEIACDEAVLRGCTDTQRYDYGEMLIQMSRFRGQGGFCLATSIGNGKWNLRERVVMLTKKRKKAWWQTAVMFVLVVVLAGCGLTKEKEAADSEVDQVKNVKTKVTDTAKEEIAIKAGEEEELSQEEKILQAFRGFMQSDIKTSPEWKNWKGKEEELYFSIQQVGSEDEAQEKAPCLLVAKKLIKGTDYASEAFVYYYDMETEQICLLTVLAGFDKDLNVDWSDENGNPYPLQIDDGELVIKARSAVRFYDWYHTKDYTKLSAQEVVDKEWNKKQEVKLDDEKEYEAWLLNSSSRYTLASIKWEIPLLPSEGQELDAAKKIRQKDIDSYASELSPASAFSPPKARDIYERYEDSGEIIFYPNTQSAWQELSGTEAEEADTFAASGENGGEISYVIHGEEDEDVLSMLAGCTQETFDKVGPTSEESVLQGPVRITYMDHFLDDDSILYFVNMGYTMRCFVLRTKGRYDAYIPDKGRWSEDDRIKDMLSSANAPQLLSHGSGMPKLGRADYDNDGEMEVAFHFLENADAFPNYEVLYLFDNNGSGSYELYTYTKDDFLEPVENFCKMYNPLKEDSWKKTKKKEAPGGGLDDYYYYLRDKFGKYLKAAYEFGHEAVYDITLEDDKTEIAVKQGIICDGKKRGSNENVYYIQIRSVLDYRGNGKFVMKDTQIIKEE